VTAAGLLGLDVGTTAVKGVALSPAGDPLAVAEASYPLRTPRPGWAEQDPEDWWRATQQVLGRLTQSVTEVLAIGFSGQMHGLVCLDEQDRVIRPAILWNDQRTAAECEAIEKAIGLQRLIQLTGNRALPGFTAPKLLWLRSQEPASFARIRHVMLPKDYIRFRLTGERAMDVTDASGTLLLEVAARRWSTEVLEGLELPPSWLPRLLESTEPAGRAPNGSPVAAGAGDQAAAAIGVGIDRPGPLSVVLGTSGVVFAVLRNYAPEPEGRAHTFCHAVPGTWHAMGVMLSAAGSLRWFRDTLAPGLDYEALLAEAAASPAGAGGLLFLPYLAGERTPHVDPAARGTFHGLSLQHDRGALTRSVLEGVAFGLRDCLELLRGLGVGSAVGRASGGGARSKFWLRVVASVLGISLEVSTVEESSALGAAMLGGVAARVFADVPQAVSVCVRLKPGAEPDRDWLPVYEDGYARFRSLYPALRALRPPLVASADGSG